MFKISFRKFQICQKKRSVLLTIAFLLVAGCSHRAPRTISIRLSPGQDVRLELEKLTKARGLKAGAVISAVGSLTQSSLRFANQKSATVAQGHFEIVSLSGTLSLDGPHLHLSVADEKGVVTGGHLTEGNIVYTTVELVILEPEATHYRRLLDSQTGSKELVIETEK